MPPFRVEVSTNTFASTGLHPFSCMLGTTINTLHQCMPCLQLCLVQSFVHVSSYLYAVIAALERPQCYHKNAKWNNFQSRTTRSKVRKDTTLCHFPFTCNWDMFCCHNSLSMVTVILSFRINRASHDLTLWGKIWVDYVLSFWHPLPGIALYEMWSAWL